MDELPYQSCSTVIRSYKMKQIPSANGYNVYCKRGMDEYIELY